MGFTIGDAPSITLQKPAVRDAAKDATVSEESAVTSGVARMTFSSGTKAQSGFTPDKEPEARPEAAQHEVRLTPKVFSKEKTEKVNCTL